MPAKYTENDEIAFISELAKRDPKLAIRYCALVRYQPRIWDETVNLGVLDRWIALFLRWEFRRDGDQRDEADDVRKLRRKLSLVRLIAATAMEEGGAA